jgi:hypothetical protein
MYSLSLIVSQIIALLLLISGVVFVQVGPRTQQQESRGNRYQS